MIKFDFKGAFCNLRFDIKDHFRKYKKYYFIFSIVLLIGLITGMLSGFKYGGDISIETFHDKVLVDFFCGRIGIFPMLLRRIFDFCILFFIIYLINLKRFLCFLNYIIITYQAYVLGINCAIFINLFNISGIINVFVVYLPCHLISLLALIGLATIFCSSCFNYKRFGENIFCSSFWQQNGRTVTFLLFISIFAFLIECILLPSLCSAFFIV